MRVFKYDTINLILNTGKVLTGFTTYKIKYESPSGVRGHWDAALGSNNMTVRATVVFDEKGIWKVQAYVSKVGETYHGMFADVRVFDPIAPTTTAVPTTPGP